MAQLLVRKLDDDVKEKLRARAAAHGRSLEEEVRIVLTDSVQHGRQSADDLAEVGLGSWIARQFTGIEEPFEIPELHWRSTRVPDFGA